MSILTGRDHGVSERRVISGSSTDICLRIEHLSLSFIIFFVPHIVSNMCCAFYRALINIFISIYILTSVIVVLSI